MVVLTGCHLWALAANTSLMLANALFLAFLIVRLDWHLVVDVAIPEIANIKLIKIVHVLLIAVIIVRGQHHLVRILSHVVSAHILHLATPHHIRHARLGHVTAYMVALKTLTQ